MHALRRLYASVLLDAGESVKVLSGYPGHSNLGFTLRVYTYLMPMSHDRTRNAVDGFFGNVFNLGNSRPRPGGVTAWGRSTRVNPS